MLNQIEKAYGETTPSSIIAMSRIAFATNDERTAKRMSDALGTATELRAMTQLCRPSACALARPCHGLAAGNSSRPPDARRSDAAASRPTSSCSYPARRRSARPSYATIEDDSVQATRAATAGTRNLCLRRKRANGRLEPTATRAEDSWAFWASRVGRSTICR